MPPIEVDKAEADTSTSTVVHVAVGVIVKDSQVCISFRPEHLHKGGLWEFPGGKIEKTESTLCALTRELQEELGIVVVEAEPMMEILWSYPEKTLLLEVMKVTGFEGEPTGIEGQQVKWVELEKLHDYAFPEANAEIVQQLTMTNR